MTEIEAHDDTGWDQIETDTMRAAAKTRTTTCDLLAFRQNEHTGARDIFVLPAGTRVYGTVDTDTYDPISGEAVAWITADLPSGDTDTVGFIPGLQYDPRARSAALLT